MRAATRFGTPLYCYEKQVLERQYLALERLLPQSCRVRFALKSNSNPAIVEVFASLGCGADVSSEGEIAAVGAAGVRAERVVFTGPAKTAPVLEQLAAFRPGFIVLESVTEAERVSAACMARGFVQPVLVRVHPLQTASGSGITLGGISAKFGIPEENLVQSLLRITEMPGIALRGIHVNTESNVRDASVLGARAADTVRIAFDVAGAGFPIDVVDFGGGLGVAYTLDQTELDLRAWARAVASAIDPAPASWTFLLEPGRWLVAQSGSYVTRVLDVRHSRGTTWVIVDGGIHHLCRPLLPEANRAVYVLCDSGRTKKLVTVAGCLCTPSDVLAAGVELADPQPGDILCFPCTGAYGYSHAQVAFGSHPAPAEVLADGPDLRLIRERQIFGAGAFAASVSSDYRSATCEL